MNFIASTIRSLKRNYIDSKDSTIASIAYFFDGLFRLCMFYALSLVAIVAIVGLLNLEEEQDGFDIRGIGNITLDFTLDGHVLDAQVLKPGTILLKFI